MKSGKAIVAHRAVYADAVGPIPAGLQVLHRCDNRVCCNPAHLFLGTNADNNADMMRKGRRVQGDVCGEKNGQSKLTAPDIRKIRRLKGTLKEIGARFGISEGHTSQIKNRIRWKHIQ